MRSRELVAMAILCVGFTPARADLPLTLGAAVERALADNADVRTAAVEARAAEARLDGASVPLASNPELSGGVGTRSSQPGGILEYEFAISQRVEIAGQRGARVAAARAALGSATARLAATRARVAAEVREMLGRVVATGLRSELAGEARRLAADAARAAETRFQAGDVPRIEVNSARIELGRATRASLEAEQERAGARAEFELLLGLEGGGAQAVAFDLDGAASGPDASLETLVQEALASRRDVAAARLDVEAATAEESLADRSVVPSPKLGVFVAREEVAHIVLGTVSFEIPLFARNQAERGVAAARVEQARVGLAALERRAVQEVRLAANRVQAARRMVAAFDVPTTAALGENLALATKAYGAGQIDFLRYQLLSREALEARRDRIDALEALNRAEAQLARALGQEATGGTTSGRTG